MWERDEDGKPAFPFSYMGFQRYLFDLEVYDWVSIPFVFPCCSK